MAREKMRLLDKSRVNTVPYIWNSSIEGDELLQVSLKELKSEQIKDAATELMTQEGIKLTLKQMYGELIEDFDKLKPKIKSLEF